MNKSTKNTTNPGKLKRKKSLLAGRNILFERTPGGLRIHAVARAIARKYYAGPFAASAVTEGDINYFSIAPGTFWTSYIGAPIAQTVHAPAANNKTIAYLKLEQQQATGIFFCVASALPINTATKAIYPLAECITDADGNITTVTQRHYGDLYPYGRII
jgi:hypothetical protein